jgi:hypothetical protein
MHPDNHYLDGALVRTACHQMPSNETNILRGKHGKTRINPDDDNVASLLSIPIHLHGGNSTEATAVTSMKTTIRQRDSMRPPMDLVTRLIPSSTRHSNISKKSGKIKSISSSGQAIMPGSRLSIAELVLTCRHDNDHNFPRSPSHIFEANRRIRDSFYAIFKPDNPLYPLTIPLIPSYGNNDVWPYAHPLTPFVTDIDIIFLRRDRIIRRGHMRRCGRI